MGKKLEGVKTKQLYRIENLETMRGMWYDKNGKFNPFIDQLTDGLSKDLPMEEHERYGKDGFRWFSGCDNIDDMRRWFSTRDALELSESNYQLYLYTVNQFVKEEHQVLFTREGIRDQKVIQLGDVWDLEDLSGNC